MGSDNPDTLAAIANYAGLLVERGRLDEAEPLLREAVATYRRVCMGAHPNTMSAIANLGALLERQGRLSDAEALYREALAGFTTALGEGHARTRETAAALERVLRTKAAQGGARNRRAFTPRL